MRFCANPNCDEILAPTSPRAAVYCGPCGSRIRSRSHGRSKCVCCAQPVTTTGRTCSQQCAEIMLNFINALRELLGLETLETIAQRKVSAGNRRKEVEHAAHPQ